MSMSATVFALAVPWTMSQKGVETPKFTPHASWWRACHAVMRSIRVFDFEWPRRCVHVCPSSYSV